MSAPNDPNRGDLAFAPVGRAHARESFAPTLPARQNAGSALVAPLLFRSANP